MKTAVLFDVGGVLFSPPQRVIAAYEKELALPRGTLAYVFTHGAPDNAFCRMERGELTLSQFFPEFEKECYELAQSRHITFPRGFSARELFQNIALGVQPIPEMIDAVKRLKDAGFKTCAITNNWIDDSRNQPDHLNQYFGQYFDAVLESCKLGLRKPDIRIYQMACEMLGVEPSECIFLDDLGTNLKPAKGLGMTTIKVQDPRSALMELGAAVGMTFPPDVHEKSPQKRGLKSRL